MKQPLILIPARAGSKGIANKNLAKIRNKPLLYYTLDVALSVAREEDICVSTDDPEIKRLASEVGLGVPFDRPPELATDHATSRDIILHALDHYERHGKNYSILVLLQPTSPFRTTLHLNSALNLFTPNLDMVVSVCETDANPYFTLFEENERGYLRKSKDGDYERRQDCPKVYLFNGSIYIINTKSLRKQRMDQFQKIKKFVMEEQYSVDVDTPSHLKYCEFLLEKGLVHL